MISTSYFPKAMLMLGVGALLYATPACKNDKKTAEDYTTTPADTMVAHEQKYGDPGKSYPDVSLNNATPKEALKTWHFIQNNHKVSQMDSILGDEISYNGKKFTKAELIDMFTTMYRQYPDHRTHYDSVSSITKLPGNMVKLDTRRNLMAGAQNTMEDVSITVQNVGGRYRVVKEEIRMTKFTKEQETRRPLRPDEINSCEKAVEAVLRSNPMAVGMMSAPKSGWKIEYGPRTKGNAENTYIIIITRESEDKSKIETLTRFYVDVATGRLQQAMPMEPKPHDVPYDENIAKYVPKLCGGK